MGDRFATFHPVVNILYFGLVLGFSMAVQHPVAQIISLGCAVGYTLLCLGRQALAGLAKLCLPMALFTAILNPLFNPQGQTVLLLLPSGNPFTAESLCYGISAGCMLATVLLWFSCFGQVITTDKFLYLFGKRIPGLAMVLSITLRFIPRFTGQLQAVTDAQHAMGRDLHKGSLWQRMKTGAAILSITVTWALENGTQSADAMKSRGYGLPDRSHYSIYLWDSRDTLCLSWLGFAGCVLLGGCMGGCFSFRYFPAFLWALPTAAGWFCWFVFLALCATPLLIHVWEERKWNSIHSKA